MACCLLWPSIDRVHNSGFWPDARPSRVLTKYRNLERLFWNCFFGLVPTLPRNSLGYLFFFFLNILIILFIHFSFINIWFASNNVGVKELVIKIHPDDHFFCCPYMLCIPREAHTNIKKKLTPTQLAMFRQTRFNPLLGTNIMLNGPLIPNIFFREVNETKRDIINFN